MRVVRLTSEVDFAGWRSAARVLRTEGVEPHAVVWTVERDLFSPPPGDGVDGVDAPRSTSASQGEKAFTVPAAFLELAEQVILHRAADRFSLLYRILWRLEHTPHLIENPADPDMARARDMAKAVSRAAHKMKAFVRFRLIEGAAKETYAAWFEPAHRVTEATAPFFARRFSNMDWTILTPDACVAWDGERLMVSEGADPADAPSEDAQEELWRTYYASIFNPARLNPRQMRQEMPKRYWRNLPEAALIPALMEAAETRAAAMVRTPPRPPSDRVLKAAQRHARDASFGGGTPTTLEAVEAGVSVCRRCELWRDATQGVPGAGPSNSPLMFVGEQPGDQEDLAGSPFVGPAGQLFDRALAEAGVPRERVYVTNAVKHFKHEARGKRRLHKTPAQGEVNACRWWLDAERRLVRPRVIVMLGATAAFSVMGQPTRVAEARGQILPLPDQAQGLVTFHPAYLLRLPDPAARLTAYLTFVEDLRRAGELSGLA
ncbi:MAG: UdgX family uracil-DNA binding protein [Proteobacteria bacterium]|nr:UdgX family uracil-DNA binding protein [Pseudomonadota bacterium]